MSHSRLWLTWDEVVELTQQITDLTDAYRGRTRSDHPDHARAWDAYRLVLPTDETRLATRLIRTSMAAEGTTLPER